MHVTGDQGGSTRGSVRQVEKGVPPTISQDRHVIADTICRGHVDAASVVIPGRSVKSVERWNCVWQRPILSTATVEIKNSWSPPHSNDVTESVDEGDFRHSGAWRLSIKRQRGGVDPLSVPMGVPNAHGLVKWHSPGSRHASGCTSLQ